MKTEFDSMPVRDARALLMAERYGDAGMVCPCCTKLAKVYRRSVTLTTVKILAKMYNVARKVAPADPTAHWIKIGVGGEIQTRGGDYAKARWSDWGLIEEREGERPDGSDRAGQWRITERGVEFLLGALRIPRYVWEYNNVPCAPPEDAQNRMISVYDVAKTFDFQSIMNNGVATLKAVRP